MIDENISDKICQSSKNEIDKIEKESNERYQIYRIDDNKYDER